MLPRFLSALLLLAFPASLTTTAALAAAPQPAARDWSKVATRLPSGAFLLGNPDARVKLVEYLSLTCPHCAHFEGEAIEPLTRKYIQPGLVSYEVRHALRDAYDFAGSLLARCDGPDRFFTVLPTVFARQNDWSAHAAQWSQTAQVDNLAPDQLFPMVAEGADFGALFGMDQARITHCVTDHDEQNLLTAQAGAAWRTPDFPGTPAFLIDGVLQNGIATWADLDQKLAAALPHNSPRKTRR